MSEVANAASLVVETIGSGPALADTGAASGNRPNILAIFGDDIGQSDISAHIFGLMG